MGFLAMFGLGGPLSEAKVAKASKLAANPFAQPEVRMREMQRLLKDGTPLALRGVLKRFSSNAQGHIADEEEKRFLSEALVGLGSITLAPLEDYIVQESKLTWVLGTYRQVAQSARATEFFVQTLRQIGPDDHRRGEAKEQLVRELGEHLDEPRVLEALTPFLLDHSDEVRTNVLDVLESLPSGTIAGDGMGKLLMATLGRLVTDPQVSARVAQSAARLIAARGWALPDDTSALHQALEPSFFVDKKHLLRPRA